VELEEERELVHL